MKIVTLERYRKRNNKGYFEDLPWEVASVNLIWPLLIFSFGPTLW
jgi:hypothetical protein